MAYDSPRPGQPSRGRKPQTYSPRKEGSGADFLFARKISPSLSHKFVVPFSRHYFPFKTGQNFGARTLGDVRTPKPSENFHFLAIFQVHWRPRSSVDFLARVRFAAPVHDASWEEGDARCTENNRNLRLKSEEGEEAKVEEHWTCPIFISCRKSPSFCEKCQSSWRKLLSYERGEIGRGNWGRPSLVNETGYIIAEK